MQALTHAEDIRVGDRFEDTWDCELVVTETGDDEITWTVDGDEEETESFSSVQTALDHNEIELLERGSERRASGDGDDGGYAKMEIADVDHEDLDESELYIRFGNTPDDERSYDNRNDRMEDGVSVYDCVRVEIDDEADTDAEIGYAPCGQMIQTIFALMFRDTYLVTGERVGTGADGEPLLRDVEAVAELKTAKGTGAWFQK